MEFSCFFSLRSRYVPDRKNYLNLHTVRAFIHTSLCDTCVTNLMCVLYVPVLEGTVLYLDEKVTSIYGKLYIVVCMNYLLIGART